MSDRKVLVERKKVLETQPLTKWISVIETDGFSTTKRKHLVRFNHTPNIDHLKNELTSSLQPVGLGPVRHIFTPAGGTEVVSLDQIQKDKEYVAGLGNQNFKKLSLALAKKPTKKKKSVSSIASNASSTSEAARNKNRLTLMQRQDMIAQLAKRKESSEAPPQQPRKVYERKKSIKKRRITKASMLVNRKPLYPGGQDLVSGRRGGKRQENEDGDLSNDILPLRGNFVRASRLDDVSPVPPRTTMATPFPTSAKSLQSLQSTLRQQSVHTNASRREEEDEEDEDEYEEDDESYASEDDDEEEEEEHNSLRSGGPASAISARDATTASRSPSPGYYSRSPSNDTRDGSSSPSGRNQTQPASPSSRPASEAIVSRPASIQSQGSFTRQSLGTGRSFGQSIVNMAKHESRVSTAASEDSRFSTAKSHNMTFTSVGRGVDNNESSANDERGALRSQGSLFSYKLASKSPKHEPRIRPVEVDYDEDEYGLFRAKAENNETRDAKEILDSTMTKIDTPVDLMKTQTIDEMELSHQLAQLRAN